MPPKRRSISDIRTSIKAKLNTKPRETTRSVFLDKFILEKTRWRLKQERMNLSCRVGEIDAHLALIEKTMTSLDEKEERAKALRGVPDVAGTPERAAAQGMKVIKVEY